ncbi:MAG TPA: hypothetical protein VKD24_03510 [Candidatus Angelobacter sp.]|nr:hypothetical protein [Candidatus Angelobacter sp.]
MRGPVKVRISKTTEAPPPEALQPEEMQLPAQQVIDAGIKAFLTMAGRTWPTRVGKRHDFALQPFDFKNPGHLGPTLALVYQAMREKDHGT